MEFFFIRGTEGSECGDGAEVASGNAMVNRNYRAVECV